MKKTMMIAVLMLLSVSAAFAGNSDALKAILKADSYTAAAKLVESSLGQLADNAEKATAYNKIVDLALAKYNEESAKVAIKKEADEAGMYDALDAAYTAAAECYKYDQLPNAKGKVKPKYSKVNAVRLYQLRPNLINGGGFFQGKDNKKAFKLLSYYVTSNSEPMFNEVKTDAAKDPNYLNAAFFAGYMAYMDHDWANAEKYAGMAVNDSANGANALNIMLTAMKAQLKTAADSAEFINKCKALYEKNPDNQMIFANLVDAYSQAGKATEAEQLVNSRLEREPNDFIALMVKGQFLEQHDKFQEAADALKKSLANAPEQNKLMLNATIGDCYLYHAQKRLEKVSGVLSKAAKEQFVPVYNEAIKYYEAAKALDKDGSQKAKYAARLYSCYYFVLGEKDPKTQEAKSYAGY